MKNLGKNNLGKSLVSTNKKQKTKNINKTKNLKDEALQLNYCEQTQFSKVSSATNSCCEPRTFQKDAHFSVVPDVSHGDSTEALHYLHVPWVVQSYALFFLGRRLP